ncbi:MAG: NAD(P)-binding protein [Acidimicrobiales bacterium]
MTSAAILDPDYLVIGSGAMGMAFTDVLLTETNASVVLVDRHNRPGGHWNHAYPFVRLHQPSAFYGVNSRALGGDTIDRTGWNAGLYELASGAEVVAYFDQVLHQQFLPSGRVQHFPMCESDGGRGWRSTLSGVQHQVSERTKVVDATYLHVTVPSIRPPRYEVADTMRCMPLNDLVKVTTPGKRYVVIGAGKTGVDACLFLLSNGVDPEHITWIMPRDPWMLDRANLQPGAAFYAATAGSAAKQIEAAASAGSITELFDALEASGALLRFDPAVRPSMYRCGTVTRAELDALRQIRDVVRLGRVQRIEPDRIVLDGGTIPTDAEVVHVDCSADGLERRPARPVFEGDRITLQTVRSCQQVFSAAFIAHVEATYDNDADKNERCVVVPHPNHDTDWVRNFIADTANAAHWRKEPALHEWMVQARLDGFSGTSRESTEQPEHRDIIRRIVTNTAPALANLNRFLAEADETGPLET